MTGSIGSSRNDVPSDSASRRASRRVSSELKRDGIETQWTRSGPSASTGDRRRQRGVDPTRDADDDLLEPVLLDVVAESELERESHLLEVVEHRARSAPRSDPSGHPRTADVDDRDLGDCLALALQRAAPHVSQPSADRLLGLDVDHEQRLFEPGRAREHLALVIEHDGVSVEDELVLAADGVDEGDVADVVSRAGRKHLLALPLLADVERRGGDVDEELRAREREVGCGRAGLPHVLADGRPDQRIAVLEQEEVAPRREVAVLVEDAVVRAGSACGRSPSPRRRRRRRRRCRGRGRGGERPTSATMPPCASLATSASERSAARTKLGRRSRSSGG